LPDSVSVETKWVYREIHGTRDDTLERRG